MSATLFKIDRGIALTAQSAAPASPTDGDFYYDAVASTFVYRQNGIWMNMASKVDVVSAADLTSANFTTTITQNSLVRITGTTLGNIHGLAGGANSKVLLLYNASTQVQTIKNQSGTEGTAANRIAVGGGVDTALLPGFTAMFVYDSTQSRWIYHSSDLTGSVSTTPNTLVRSSGTSGHKVQGTGIVVDNSDNMSITGGSIAVTNNTSGVPFSSATNNGNTSAQSVWQIQNSSFGNTVGLQIFGYGVSSTPGPGFQTFSARGPSTAPTSIQSGDLLGHWRNYGYGTTAFGQTVANLEIRSQAAFTDASMPTEFRFRTTAVGSAVIDSNSDFIIANTNLTMNKPSQFVQYTYANSDQDGATTGSNATLTLANASIHRLANASLVSITNITPTASGRFLTLVNVTGNSVTIINDAGGTAANRIVTGTGADFAVPPNAVVDLYYDQIGTRWRIRGVSGITTFPTIDVALMNDQATPSTPPAASKKFYAKTAGMFYRNDAGTEHQFANLLETQTFNNKTILGDNNTVRNVQVFNSSHAANFTLNATHEVVYIDANASGKTITFPNASLFTFKSYTIRKVDTTFNQVILTGTGMTTNRLMTYGETVTYVSNGTTWEQTHRTTDTNWIPYTVTWLNQGPGTLPQPSSTADHNQGYWRRVGDSIEVRYEYNQNAAGDALNGTGGEFQWAIPNHTVWTYDAAKVTFIAGTSRRSILGHGYFQINGVGFNPGPVYLAGTNKVAIIGATGGGNAIGTGSAGQGIQGSTQYKLSIMYTMPITNFEANQ